MFFRERGVQGRGIGGGGGGRTLGCCSCLPGFGRGGVVWFLGEWSWMGLL